MTDLQMGLMGLGATAVIVVLAYNKWQEHKHRKLAEQLLNARQADVLLDETLPGEMPASSPAQPEPAARANTRKGRERFDPLLDGGQPAAAEGMPDERTSGTGRIPAFLAASDPVILADDISPELEATVGAGELPGPREIGTPLHVLSPLIDYIAALEFSSSVGAYRLRETQRVALQRIEKAINWIGYNEESNEWDLIADDSDRAYRHVRVGLQMVDRRGPLRSSDLSIFDVAVHDLATELGGLAELPLRETALEAAAELDQFCAGVDIQIGINVISQGQVFAGTKLRALAESAGMVIDPAGRFARCDDDGSVLYHLVNQEDKGFSAEAMKSLTTHGVTFLLDVPCVASGDRVLSQMFEQARRFADSLHGALVDDNRHPLSEKALEPIRRQVMQYQAAMSARHLAAGGPLALRLFS
ncbi:MAG TPA: cell division protein ZipA C-terminal FtsZ-binding domain-containing protein [Accumulibacter sp.]|uniref:cell division protein ZipA C-terminal FtsZ-binding domain-containing protein n=2 Tax=Accumulibacter sp. TaxID=2053492 RepID=UPI002878EBEF|nr:cell division protein ZipA C-terminal FtsZ-binding domain-containing protein [Accumulibacter sp.]MDS4054874.1 cell division protein ZipA C-terminal FtsZ-binding domain-containing protein [Accumulibacter sp.]HMV05754.1 cell division protein ZipA C-terminal FtsZ-binding domain-containing protein [Accumulibacter sp.]HMX68411.1 cell division protein ZipA C-terminal FtsZ-binding domain-containing protein [Accumulibacter sp.]HNB68469.1 cell division protein ZipA C-terminal FtsZ-binding domain-cont